MLNVKCYISPTDASVVSTAVFGQGKGPVFLDQVHCIGTEDRLMECSHDGIGSHICGQFTAFLDEYESEHEFDVAINCKGLKLHPSY